MDTATRTLRPLWVGVAVLVAHLSEWVMPSGWANVGLEAVVAVGARDGDHGLVGGAVPAPWAVVSGGGLRSR